MKFTDANNQVILICNQFRNYPQRIKEELETMGANVDFFSDQPPFLLYRKMPKIFKNMVHRMWLSHLLRHITNHKYNYIFLVKGQGLNKSFMDCLVASQPQARKLYYTWDSLYNYDCSWLIPYFDTCFTFDMADALKRNDMHYLPLFHDGVKKNSIPRQIDLFTLSGGGYNFRKAILDNLITNMADSDLNIQFFLLNKKKYLRQIIKKEKNFRYLWKPMPYERYKELLQQSNTVVDIHHEGQTGFTMRTIEALSMGCKLATTNSALLIENPAAKEWIYILDRKNPRVEIPFLEKYIFEPLDLNSYSITNFLHQIFSIRYHEE